MNRIKKQVIAAFLLAVLTAACNNEAERLWKESSAELEDYRAELNALRAECRTKEMPDAPFFLFGMGDRVKMLYKNGRLTAPSSGKTIGEWAVKEELIVPSLYRVVIRTTDGETVMIEEDEDAVWLTDKHGNRTALDGTTSHLSLPLFADNKYGRILRTLHQEILINIVEGVPLPNYLVYKKGWRRDGAMVAMCLEKTGNTELIRRWVLGFTEPYDRNNAGEEEADNLGQTLYLLSLFTDSSHPAVVKTLEETRRFERTSPQGKYICGRSDFHETPAYQTKFLKWGLQKLGLPDEYIIPQIADNYSALFWQDFRDSYVPTADAADDDYPYLGWAADHFHGTKSSPVSNRDYPLTWETNASQADYEGIRIVDERYVNQRTATPHTWHDAEIFLYLLDISVN